MGQSYPPFNCNVCPSRKVGNTFVYNEYLLYSKDDVD